MAIIRFSEHLRTAMEMAGATPKKLEEILCERGVYNITNKRISEYTLEISTPSFSKARLIMQALEYPIEDDDLSNALQLNRELIRSDKEEQAMERRNGYGRTIRPPIRLRNLIPGEAPIDIERKLHERVRNLYGNEDIVSYIERLIAADLKDFILNEDQ